VTAGVQGYAEGYYGRLFSWEERLRVLDALQANHQNTYYYAPKEDIYHRWQWRTAYPDAWLKSFSAFCLQARQRGINVVAGVAPGLDFNFKDLPSGPDYLALVNKCQGLLAAGAQSISLLLDDIDEDFPARAGGFNSEGRAHATLANTIADAVAAPIWLTPRIYANELASDAPNYLPDCLSTLGNGNTLIYCGSDVVSRRASVRSIDEVVDECYQPMVLWDNLYANDYCPRRLFMGPWTCRDDDANVLLNPTGMVNTDCLLLEMMRDGTRVGGTSEVAHDAWVSVLKKHGVPDAFLELAAYFYHPVFNSEADSHLAGDSQTSTYIPERDVTAATYEAIEECLWCWKTPLSREWYPYIFGLKHDLLVASSQLPEDRIYKTQTHPLASTLLK